MRNEHFCDITIWGRKVGTMALYKGRYLFQYDSEFSNSNLQLSPLNYPLSRKVYDTTTLTHFGGIPGFLADSLPDGFGCRIVEKHFQDQYGISPFDITSIQKLLYVGSRGPGALEFSPPEDSSPASTETLRLSELVEQSRKIISGSIDDVLPELFRHSTDSLGGAKAKAAIAWSPDRNTMISGAGEIPEGYEHWILKFDGMEKEQLKKSELIIEHLYLGMARDCGINVPNSVLLKDGFLTHLAVKRFDRDGNSKPVHMHSLAGLTGMDFRDRDTMSYDKFLRVALAITGNRTQLDETFRRMCFNVIVGNQDDHAKNHAFLMNTSGIWTLSPAYDITYSYGYGHQMNINGKTKGVKHSDLLAMGKAFEIENPQQTIDTIVDVVSTFQKRAVEAGIAQERIEQVCKSMRLSENSGSWLNLDYGKLNAAHPSKSAQKP